MPNVIKLVTEFQRENNRNESIQDMTLFWMLFYCKMGMTNERIKKSAKKDYSKHRSYATLYRKLTACLAVNLRGLLLPGRIGETCL